MSLLRSFRSRPGLNQAIGITLAVIAGLMLLGYASRALKGERGGRMVRVPVARRDISLGTQITGDMLGSRSIPAGYVVPGTLRDPDDVRGARAIRFIGKGEPVTASAISGGGGAGSLAAKIPADMRAYTINLSSDCPGSTEVRPGDKVDVLSTAGDPPRTCTLLGARSVLSVSASPDGEGVVEAGAPQSLTLLVSPREAELLAQASCSGEISVAVCPTQ